MIDDLLKKILACPECHSDVVVDEKNNKIKCVNCKRVYPIVDDIPIMLVEESYVEKTVEEESEKK